MAKSEVAFSKAEVLKKLQVKNSKENLEKIMEILSPMFPDHKPMLNFNNPFELLIATALAAQCSDIAVNKVTLELFRRFPGPAALAEAPLQDLETIVHSLGFFHAKAHNIRALSKQLHDKFNDTVPQTMEELTTLPGVGRKTASVILSVCFNVPAIAVDTHFARVSGRLGLTSSDRPEVIEENIKSIAPEDEWIAIGYVLNFFGRSTCHAKKPKCESCPVNKLCPAYGKEILP
ncbi:MAG: endonuclease III [Treponema sp.]|nr:endonuclease III [Treponema sp.]